MDNIKCGEIWTVRSCNETDEYYEGMTCGCTQVMVVSTYDENDIRKFTYLKTSKTKKYNGVYLEMEFRNKPLYIAVDTLHTGDIRALESPVDSLDYNSIKTIINYAQTCNK